MGVILVLLGALIGLSIVMYFGGPPTQLPGSVAPRSFTEQVLDAQAGIYFGVSAALLIWLIMWATAVGAGDSILLKTAKARQIRKEDAPQLWNAVEEMTIASGLGKMPRLYVIDDSAPNAFAVGYRPQKAAVAVTSGLLKRLSRDELQGVVAHEIGHVRNLDVRFMTLAGVMVGAIILLSHGFVRGMFFGGGRRRSSSRGGGHAQLILLAVAILVAILAPLAAQLLYFSCSRRREFLADASSAQFTRYPEGLASALEKISKQAGGRAEVNKVVAPMYIVNPLQARSALGLFSTHPKTIERIGILRSMAGAGFAAYEAAYQRMHGAGKHCIGSTTLKAAELVAVRPPTLEPKTREQAVARAREVGQLLDQIINFVVIPCVCGLRLKLPPDFKRDSLTCPRCGRKHAVPKAEAASRTPTAAGAQAKGVTEPLRYRRKGTGWESFQCSCGQPIQLSPRFTAPQVECTKCKRRIEVMSASER